MIHGFVVMALKPFFRNGQIYVRFNKGISPICRCGLTCG